MMTVKQSRIRELSRRDPRDYGYCAQNQAQAAANDRKVMSSHINLPKEG